MTAPIRAARWVVQQPAKEMRRRTGGVLPHFDQLPLVTHRREQVVGPLRQRFYADFALLALKLHTSANSKQKHALELIAQIAL